MTAEIINLNKARKAKARAGAERRAEENRVRHGRTRAERKRDEAERERDLARVEGARRADVDDDPEPGSVS